MTVSRPVTINGYDFNFDYFSYNLNYEVSFTVTNVNRIVPAYGQPGAGQVNLLFSTNNLMDPTDVYLLQLKFKE